MQRKLGCASLPGSLILQQRTVRAVAAAALSKIQDVTDWAGTGPATAGVIPRRQWSSQRRPLSANQQQMWLLHSMGMAAAYNIQVGEGRWPLMPWS